MSHKILLIDDDKINTSVIKFSLASEQYEVVMAADGEEGLATLKSQKPDLVILDIQMPNMNGYEFMGELHADSDLRNIPVIMLTANETMEDVFKMEGVKGYFVKPVELPQLVGKIIECLGPNPV